tara:strand:+ start:56 stop:1180 length:1125 start_codon:yes stop_codon:yes gene_type:complete
MKRVMVVGAGWAGASVSYELKRLGFSTCIFESTNKTGGHSRSEVLNNIIYEPNGPHIFHTSNPIVNNFVKSFGMKRKFTHRVKSRIYPNSLKGDSILVSWPPQISELKNLEEWKNIEIELNNLPPAPLKENFETYAISIMGRTLYELFISGYTEKQWGLPAKELSSEFAPKRIDLRTDDNTALFKDKWEYYHPNGSGEIIENILKNDQVELNKKLTLNNIDSFIQDFDAVVITAPLDDFIGSSHSLEWRGIRTETEYFNTKHEDECVTEAYQINHPSLNEKYTRTIETKHASGQKINGTVVGKEYSQDGIRHYPVLRSSRDSREENNNMKKLIIKELSVYVDFCGRLPNYEYINQDRAIEQGFECGKRIYEKLR